MLVSPLFRRNPEKVERRAAAQREVERLRALSVDELAVALMPGLGPDGPTKGTSVRVQQLCEHLLADFPGAGRSAAMDLLAPARRALQLLHGAGLVAPISVQRDPVWRITPLGEVALAEGTVRQRVTREA